MASDKVIVAEGLSKKYELGQTHSGGGLRHAIEDAIRGRREAPPAKTEFWALKDLNLEIRRGEIVGIIGRNGAGKSTLLKLLSRITEPTTGRIGIKGRVASLLEVGTGFHPELTGRENIFLNGAILGMSRKEIRANFDAIVEFAEVSKFLDTPVKRYSSGMYVRLAFAVAAHLDPEILIVDEVLAVGDAQFQKKCLGKMKEVSSGGGRTVLFVSHAMHSVRALCTTGILLSEGRIQKRGTVAEVVDAYSGTGGPEGAATNKATGVSLLGATIQTTGEDALITVKASFHLDRTIPNAGVGIHIEAASGYELCDLRPESSGLTFGDRSGTLEIEFTLGPLTRHLAAGSYRLGLSFHETNWKRCLDRTPVGEFVVPATDLYGTGYPPRVEKDGALVFPIGLVHVR